MFSVLVVVISIYNYPNGALSLLEIFLSAQRERRKNFLLQCQLSVLTLLFRYPFHLRITAAAPKKIPVILPKVQVAGYN